MNILIVAGGGAIGAVLRYAIYTIFGAHFGTLFVNIVGSFLALFLITLLSAKFSSDPALKLFLIVGVMGGFTTFSAFSVEVVDFLREALYLKAFYIVVLNNILSIGAGILAVYLASKIYTQL